MVSTLKGKKIASIRSSYHFAPIGEFFFLRGESSLWKSKRKKNAELSPRKDIRSSFQPFTQTYLEECVTKSWVQLLKAPLA